MMTNPILLDLPMPITTERLIIRPMMPGDGAMINEAVNESISCLKEWLPWAQQPLTVEESEETARRFYADFILRKAMHLIILNGDDGRFIGGTGFNTLKGSIPSGDIGYWCRTSEQGHGYIREAVNALVFYGFEAMGLRRVTIKVDA